MSDSDTRNTTIHRRELDRLEEGRSVKLRYYPVRGNKEPKTRSGEILLVNALGNDEYKFWFYDEDANRKIEVTLRGTMDASSVRSMKNETYSTIGEPLRILVSRTENGVDAIDQDYLLARRDGHFEPVIAAAEIEWNAPIVQWMITQ